MGENILTKGIPLLDLPKDTILKIGKTAKIQIMELRNPCVQLDKFQKGLMKAILDKKEDLIEIAYPPKPHLKLERV